MTDYPAEFKRLSQLIDAGLATVREQVHIYAEAEDAYNESVSEAFVIVRAKHPEFTVPEKEAFVKSVTAKTRKALSIADGMRQAARQAVNARMAQISALQSLLAAERAEMELTRTGP